MLGIDAQQFRDYAFSVLCSSSTKGIFLRKWVTRHICQGLINAACKEREMHTVRVGRRCVCTPRTPVQ
jgi:hypothetical protein